MLPEIVLKGNAFERGFEHGQALGGIIRSFLADNCARINILRESPLREDQIREMIGNYAAIIREDIPEIAEELRGLAAGANIPYEDAVLLQIRMELIYYREQNQIEGDCSSVALLSFDNNRIAGQTVDLSGDMIDLGCVFRILPEDENFPEILMFGFAGLLGYMGLNSYGLSININMVVSNDWLPGVSPYLLVRHLLNFGSVKECILELTKIRISSSRSLLIGDKNQQENVEFTAREIRTFKGNCLLHTNHYLHQDLVSFDSMHFLFRNSSIKRLELLQSLLPLDLNAVSPEMLFRLFSDHSLFPVGICAHNEGNIRRAETVGAIVLQPNEFMLHACKGHPCIGSIQTFKMKNPHQSDYKI